MQNKTIFFCQNIDIDWLLLLYLLLLSDSQNFDLESAFPRVLFSVRKMVKIWATAKIQAKIPRCDTLLINTRVKIVNSDFNH